MGIQYFLNMEKLIFQLIELMNPCRRFVKVFQYPKERISVRALDVIGPMWRST